MINKNFIKIFLPILSLVTPAMTIAAFNLASSDFRGVVDYVVGLLYIAVPILSSLAFLLFFWGLSKFILSGSGDQANRKKGKEFMMWGILALFILLTYRAIVGLITGDLGFGDATVIPLLPTGP